MSAATDRDGGAGDEACDSAGDGPEGDGTDGFCFLPRRYDWSMESWYVVSPHHKGVAAEALFTGGDGGALRRPTDSAPMTNGYGHRLFKLVLAQSLSYVWAKKLPLLLYLLKSKFYVYYICVYVIMALLSA